jgi:hypothetical protein
MDAVDVIVAVDRELALGDTPDTVGRSSTSSSVSSPIASSLVQANSPDDEDAEVSRAAAAAEALTTSLVHGDEEDGLWLDELLVELLPAGRVFFVLLKDGMWKSRFVFPSRRIPFVFFLASS